MRFGVLDTDWVSASVRGSNVDRVCFEIWGPGEGSVYCGFGVLSKARFTFCLEVLAWEGSVRDVESLHGPDLGIWGSDVVLNRVAAGVRYRTGLPPGFGVLMVTGSALRFGIPM